MGKKALEYVVAGAVSTVASVGGAYYALQPRSAHIGDLDGDGRVDLAVKDRIGFTSIYIQQADGTYKRLETLSEEARRSIDVKDASIRERVAAALREVQ